MFRSTSPAPSIAPSFESAIPSAWTDIDPLAAPRGPRSTAESADIPVHPYAGGAQKTNMEGWVRRSEDSNGASRDAVAINTDIGTFNAGWGWESAPKDGLRFGEEGDPANPKTTKRNRANLTVPLGATPLKASRRGTYLRSESTDLLHPGDAPEPTASDSSCSSPSNEIADYPTSPKGSKTPPCLTTGTKKKVKSRRPASLNLPPASSSDPPPPTSNKLSPKTRSDLLKKNRKLQQVLGLDYYTGTNGPKAHRPTKSEDAGPTATFSVNMGKAALEKMAISTGLAVPKPTVSTRDDSSTHRTQRIHSESLLSSQRKRSDRHTVSSSHILLNQGSAVDDVHPTPRRRSVAKGSKRRPSTGKSASRPHRHSHATIHKSRSRSGSHAGAPPSAESFMDFSSDAGEHLTRPNTELVDTDSSERQDVSSIEIAAGDAEPAPTEVNPAVPEILPPSNESDPSGAISPSSSRSKTPRPGDFGRPAPLQLQEHTESPRTGRTHEKRLSLASRSSSTPPVTPSAATSGHSTHAHVYALPTRSLSTSSISTFETAQSIDIDALERKRRRDRLLKLYRYLGSNVPATMVVGVPPPGKHDLPPAVSEREVNTGVDSVRWWKQRKRSTISTLGTPPAPETDSENAGLPMSGQDRAFNVKRKAKMEKVFGERLPQDLFVLRRNAEAEESDGESIEDASSLSAGGNSLEFLRHSHSLKSLRYLIEKDDVESLRNLVEEITKEDPLSDADEEIVFAPPERLEDDEDDEDDELLGLDRKIHPRRDLRRRLLLPQNTPGNRLSSPLLLGSSSSLRTAGARSPALFPDFNSLRSTVSPLAQTPGAGPSSKTSPGTGSPTASVANTLAEDPRSVDGFQQRRRRAAKLTQFFGTEYRSLFGEVLASIETDVMEHHDRGTLTAQEVQELLSQVQLLKAQ